MGSYLPSGGREAAQALLLDAIDPYYRRVMQEQGRVVGIRVFCQASAPTMCTSPVSFVEGVHHMSKPVSRPVSQTQVHLLNDSVAQRLDVRAKMNATLSSHVRILWRLSAGKAMESFIRPGCVCLELLQSVSS